MIRLRVDDPMLAPELLTYLRRCQCDVEYLGPTTLEVCLGHSIDVKTAIRQFGGGLSEHTIDLGEGPVRDEWARMEVEAYLKVWCTLHPECSVQLVA